MFYVVVTYLMAHFEVDKLCSVGAAVEADLS